jgi:hypothetical protein
LGPLNPIGGRHGQHHRLTAVQDQGHPVGPHLAVAQNDLNLALGDAAAESANVRRLRGQVYSKTAGSIEYTDFDGLLWSAQRRVQRSGRETPKRPYGAVWWSFERESNLAASKNAGTDCEPSA